MTAPTTTGRPATEHVVRWVESTTPDSLLACARYACSLDRDTVKEARAVMTSMLTRSQMRDVNHWAASTAVPDRVARAGSSLDGARLSLADARALTLSLSDILHQASIAQVVTGDTLLVHLDEVHALLVNYDLVREFHTAWGRCTSEEQRAGLFALVESGARARPADLVGALLATDLAADLASDPVSDGT